LISDNAYIGMVSCKHQHFIKSRMLEQVTASIEADMFVFRGTFSFLFLIFLHLFCSLFFLLKLLVVVVKNYIYLHNAFFEQTESDT
jgi:hypothetical protein